MANSSNGCVLRPHIPDPNYVCSDDLLDLKVLRADGSGKNKLSYINFFFQDAPGYALPASGHLCSACVDLFARRPVDSCRSSWHSLKNKRTLLAKSGFALVTVSNYFSTYKALGFQPNDKLCNACVKAKLSVPVVVESSDSDNDEPFVSPPSKKQALENLNQSLTAIPGISPIQFGKRNTAGQVHLVNKTVTMLQEKVVSSFEEVGLPVNREGHDFKSTQKDSKDLRELMDLLKIRIQGCSKQEQKSLLTLCPPSWTKNECATFFDVSKNLIRNSRNKLKESGILPTPTVKEGKKISAIVKAKVVAFFNDDKISRCCPGKSDVVSVKNSITGKREKKQKRYLLANMIELHHQFKVENPDDKIGKSRFFSLRPKECYSQNTRGFHNVCLCVYHENVKLLCSAIGISSIKPLLAILVCDVQSKDCAYRRCDECKDKKTDLAAHIQPYIAKLDKEIIRYKRWLTTDGAQYVTEEKTKDDFENYIVSELELLAKHHYLSKTQQSFFDHTKKNLKDGEVIIWGDFAENYSPLTQNAIQSDHWTHKQVTLHPFMIYYKAHGQDFAFPYCIISDSTQHDTNTVFAFQKHLLKHITEALSQMNVPPISYVYYFSDGCAAQYKNRKNFYNLYYHQKDFGIPAEWHFFATAHGKGPCDGIGGTGKREARLASLQGQDILTALDMFEFCKKKIRNVEHLMVSEDDIASAVEEHGLSERNDKTTTLPGTQKAHRFLPLNNGIVAYETSFDKEPLIVKEIESETRPPVLLDDDCVGDWVLTVYDGKWYIARVEELNKQDEEVSVAFFKGSSRTRGTTFVPELSGRQQSTCWLSYGHILKKIATPTFNRTGRSFQVTLEDQLEFDKVLESFLL